MTKKFLHVGCGLKRKAQTTPGFNTDEWTEIRFDIDEGNQPDILGTMLDMSAVETGSMDALYSSHNIEHLYAHEVPLALAEFRRVLKPNGFLVMTCPDIQAVCALIAEDKLTEAIYQSPSGPITPLDILYGHRASMEKGNLYMAHKVGFTQSVLDGTVGGCGFSSRATTKRGHPNYDLWIVATVDEVEESVLLHLAREHFSFN